MAHIWAMAYLIPIILAVLYGWVSYVFSARNSRKNLDRHSTLLKDPTLNKFTADMAATLELENISVHVYEVDMVNGLAAADGRIFLTRGFMRKYAQNEVSAEELASVIAHELGHVALGHSRRRMIDFSGQNAMRTALAMLLSRFIPGFGPWIANFLISIVAARLSRKDEFEADAYATALMMQIGLGAGPQIALFEKLEALVGASAQGPAWLLSHPKTAQRIKAIQKNARRWKS